MEIFSSEQELLSTLDKFDQLVKDCILSKISFAVFLKQYNNFFYLYALDGHESDSQEKMLFQKHESRISLHRDIAEKVLSKVYLDKNKDKIGYAKADRFGSDEAIQIMKMIVEKRKLT